MRPNIAPLTAVRFFAALAVVIFHYNRKLEIFPVGIASFGYESVTFFFVLSGFILTYTHGRDEGINVTNEKFAISRIARIAPAYFLALIIASPFAVKTATFDVAMVPLMLQAWWPPAALLWNSPAWSLSNEMFFYALYPATWAVFRRLSQSTSMFLACALVLAVSLFRAGPSDNFTAYFPLLNLPQFILGVALGKLFLEKGTVPSSNLIFSIAIAILCVVVAYKPEALWLGSNSVLCFVFGVLIYALAGLTSIPKNALSSSKLMRLGNSSYAIYILHVPLWLWWDRIFRVSLGLDIRPDVDFIMYVTFVVLISLQVTSLLETPSRKWISKLSRQ